MKDFNELLHIKKFKTARSSLFVAILIVTLKLSAALWSGSLAILSELFHSSTDFFAAVITVFSVKYSSKPPDKDHHYGHEKIESFSALFQVLILVMMCIYLLYESVVRIIHPPPDVNIDFYSFAIIVFCILLDFTRSKTLKRVAKETHSQALEADALHFSSDILSSGVVLFGIALYHISPIFDPIAAIIVSVIIIFTTVNLSKKAFDSLMDKVPKGLYENIYKAITTVEGVDGIKNLRVRSTGSKIFIDAVINVGRTKLFYETHEITDKVEEQIKSIANNSDIVIHTEPVETEDETVNDKIRIIVNREGYRCHDIFSYKFKDKVIVELHIEISHTNDLVEAHNTVSNIERKIQSEIFVIDEVKVYLDEPSGLSSEAEDVTTSSNDIIRISGNIISEYKFVESLRVIKVFRTVYGIRIICDCEFDNSIPFNKVHNYVTELESKIFLKIKEYYPELINVNIHSEPSEKKI